MGQVMGFYAPLEFVGRTAQTSVLFGLVQMTTLVICAN